MARAPTNNRSSKASGIAAALRRELAEGDCQPGDRFASQNELAKRFQTSTVTAREAVLLLVREGLLERHFGSGTYVTGRSPERFVAVVTELDISHPAVSPAFLTMLQAVRRHVSDAGLQTRVYIGHASPFERVSPMRISSWEFWHDLEEGRIIGLVTVGTEPKAGKQAVAERDIPLIDGHDLDGVPFWDANELVQTGVDALRRKGCRSLACVATGKLSRNELLDWASEEASRHGIATRPEWMVSVAVEHERGDGAAAFQSIWLSHDDKPDGLLVLDDMLYHDMATALLLNDIRIPEDLVVASHANAYDHRPFVPEPIRLIVDMEAVGEAMARNLVKRMKNPAAPPEGIPVPIRVTEPDNLAEHEARSAEPGARSQSRRSTEVDGVDESRRESMASDPSRPHLAESSCPKPWHGVGGGSTKHEAPA